MNEPSVGLKNATSSNGASLAKFHRLLKWYSGVPAHGALSLFCSKMTSPPIFSACVLMTFVSVSRKLYVVW